MQSVFWLKLYWIITDAFDTYKGESIYQTGSRWLNKLYRIRSTGLEGFFGFMADLEPLIVDFTVAQPDDMGCTDLFDDQKSSINEYLSRLNLGITFEDFLPTFRASRVRNELPSAPNSLRVRYNFRLTDYRKLNSILSRADWSFFINVHLSTRLSYLLMLC